MKNIAFLFDKTNDWLSQYFPEALKSSQAFDVHVFYEEEKIRGFELVFVLGYTKVLKGEILSSNKILLVVHESDLPEGRGFAPVQWQILEGKTEITVCLLEISDEVDAGNIFGKMILSLDGSELYEEIRKKQAVITFDLISKFLERYPNLNSEIQQGKPTFYRRRRPSDSQLDLDKTIRDQFNLLRICNNNDWPAFFELDGVRYTIKIDKVS
ncbi:formyltransferase family protein [bacterium]|nr:formyltransferase family protein [bacterium]